MRLKRVNIKGYKNLKDFSLTFEEDSLINIFVGKNGSGKSNLLEALIEVFDSIFDNKKNGRPDGFEYTLLYEIDGEDTELNADANGLRINGKTRSTIASTPVPESLVVYYSGQNETVANLVRRYRDRFQASIKGAEVLENPKIIGIGPDYKELLMAIMLLLPEDNVARNYIISKLNIVVSGGTATLSLQRPSFAKKNMDYDPLDPKMVFWGTEGTAKEFLDNLLTCVDGEFNIRDLYNKDTDLYTIPIDISLFRTKFKDNPIDLLFRKFHALRIIGMMQSLYIPMRLESGQVIPATSFSDGQFQSVYLFTISELFKNTNCLTLLDEPDAFMHPEWQNQYLSQIKEISGDAARSNHILMTSHSASTIAADSDCPIHLLSSDGSNVVPRIRDKQELIDDLSAGVIAFSEEEAKLNITHFLKNTTGPIVFVEGISDEIILETAWSKLYPNQEREFEIQQAFECGFLYRMLGREDMYREHRGRSFFGLYDFDDAYNFWNIKDGEPIEERPEQGLVMKRPGKESYSMLLPVPTTGPIRNQVIDQHSGQHFCDNSRLSIELMFYGAPGTDANFEIDPTRPGGCIRFKGKKTRFARRISRLPARHFEAFRPTFEFVLAKTTQ